jgi:hypothetical protein
VPLTTAKSWLTLRHGIPGMIFGPARLQVLRCQVRRGSAPRFPRRQARSAVDPVQVQHLLQHVVELVVIEDRLQSSLMILLRP